MDRRTQTYWESLHAHDPQARYEAFLYLLNALDRRVDWAYEIWDALVRELQSPDHHMRAIAAQLLCKLARSDPENRMRHDFKKVFAVTYDEKFVTARHTLQALWQVGVAGEPHQRQVVRSFAQRFADAVTEKNRTLIRYDIIVGLRKLYAATRGEKIRRKALALVETETDPKARAKYARVWRTVR